MSFIFEDYYETIDIHREIIYDWYLNNNRKFLWRTTNDPYYILIAEMMLHRTGAKQVSNVYGKFLRNYPAVYLLANSDFEKANKILKPLGLKNRYKVFIDAAKFIVNKYNGIIPKSKRELLLIPGVGDYIAGMVMNCAFGGKEYVVDTNIARVFNRILDINLKGDIRRNKEIIMCSSIYFDTDNSRQNAYAILDFASAVCKSVNPLCQLCPINKYGLCALK